MEDTYIVYNESSDRIETNFHCPVCKKGLLSVDNTLSTYRVNKEYESSRQPVYIYDYISQISGFLICDYCPEEIAFVGSITGGTVSYETYEMGEVDSEEELLYFKYLYPPIHRIEIIEEYPDDIKEYLLESFAFSFNHKISCLLLLNKLFERLVNDLCDVVKIDNNANFENKISQLFLKNKYSKIKYELRFLEYYYNLKSFKNLENTNFIKHYKKLEAVLEFMYKKEYNEVKSLILTEGKTDWKHLKKALERFQKKGKYLDLNIEFKEFNNMSTSDTELANYAESLAKQVNGQKTICIFDRDLPNRLKDYGRNEFTHVANKQLINTIKDKCKNEYGERSKKYLDIEKELEISNYKKIDEEIKSILTGKEYEEWKVILNNNVYAFCIPPVSRHFTKLIKMKFLNTEIKLTLRDFQHHYKEFGKNSIDKLNEICIEFYYKEEELKKEDSKGKRLFTADEFKFNKKTNDCNQFISKCGKFKTDTQSGNNKNTKYITLQYPNKNDRGYVYRNDDEECNKSTNMNLSKNEFAENIYNEVEGFNDFDIDNFRLIFDVIEKIVND